MDQKDLCEHTRIRLIAAAVGHQQCTKTESTLIPLPGAPKFIAIGTLPAIAKVLMVEPPASTPPSTAPAPQTDPQQSESIDKGRQFHRLLADFGAARFGDVQTARERLIAYIDSRATIAPVATQPVYQVRDKHIGAWCDVREQDYALAPIDGRRTLYAAPVAAQQAAAKAPAAQAVAGAGLLGYAIFRDGRQVGIERTKAQAERWVDAQIIPLIDAATPASTPEASQQATAVAAPGDDLRLAICNIPLPACGSNSFQHGFVSAKEAVLDLLSKCAAPATAGMVDSAGAKLLISNEIYEKSDGTSASINSGMARQDAKDAALRTAKRRFENILERTASLPTHNDAKAGIAAIDAAMAAQQAQASAKGDDNG